MPSLHAFPTRPVAYQTGSIGLGRYIGSLFFLGAGLFWIIRLTSLPLLANDLLVWSGGTPAPDAQASGGRCVSRTFMQVTSCDFDLGFTPPQGRPVERHVTYHTYFTTIDTHERLEVRYDPADPQRFATSWGRALITSRLLSAVADALLVVLLAGAGIVGLRGILRDREEHQDLRAGGSFVEATVLERVDGPNYTNWSLRWTDPGDRSTRSRWDLEPTAWEPIWLDGQKTRVIALVTKGGRAKLVSTGLHLLDLTPAEKQQVLASWR